MGPQRREHPNIGVKHQTATTRPRLTGSAVSTTARAKLWPSHPGSTARESSPASAASPGGAVRSISRCADNQSEPAAAPSDPAPTPTAAPPGGIQIVQQLITPTGEIHQIPPVQLNTQQLQMIAAQMVGGAGSSQPIVIHTAPIQTQLAHPAQTVQTIQLQGGQHVYNIQQQY